VEASLTAGDLLAWSADVVVGPLLGGGAGDALHAAIVGDEAVVVRRTACPADALDWELDLLEHLDGEGFLVPTVLPTVDGRRHVHGTVVTRWIDGRLPSREDDWHAVGGELDRLHAATTGWPQRPGCCRARDLVTRTRGGDVDLVEMPPGAVGLVRAAWAELPDGPDAVVHGDPGPRHVRVRGDGQVALLGWDRARVDCPWFDLADLPVRRLRSADAANAGAAAHAWEAASAWTSEPNYARWRLDLLDGYRAAR
jgi:Ser/Thr protein kinase RdoA (MazF antagonist)